MPIRPENRARYPRDWRAISDAVRFGRAQGWCDFCRLAEHGKPHPILAADLSREEMAKGIDWARQILARQQEGA